jgi:hypothetical protein
VLGVTSHTWKCMFVIHVLLSYLNILQFVSQFGYLRAESDP